MLPAVAPRRKSVVKCEITATNGFLTMDPLTIYAICVAGILALLCTVRVGDTALRTVRIFSTNHLRSHFLYTIPIARWAGSTNVRIVDACVLATYIASNATVMAVRVVSLSQLSQRACAAFAINLVLLSVGGRTSLLIDKLLRVDRATWESAHRWIGRAAVAQGLLHGFASLTSQARGASRLGVPVRTSPQTKGAS